MCILRGLVTLLIIDTAGLPPSPGHTRGEIAAPAGTGAAWGRSCQLPTRSVGAALALGLPELDEEKGSNEGRAAG